MLWITSWIKIFQKKLSYNFQLYSFGETVSIVMWTENWQPDSFYDKISANRQHGLHTLCLLDIKTKEQSVENLIKCTNLLSRFIIMNFSEDEKFTSLHDI